VIDYRRQSSCAVFLFLELFIVSAIVHFCCEEHERFFCETLAIISRVLEGYFTGAGRAVVHVAFILQLYNLSGFVSMQ
jgi:hypothetical protein